MNLLGATAGALLTAVVGWAVLQNLLWIGALVVGPATGEVASRIARRRVNRSLEVAVGASIVVAFVAASWLRFELAFGSLHVPATLVRNLEWAQLNDPVSIIIVAIAVVLAVTRLNR
jgi:hypothetical protein